MCYQHLIETLYRVFQKKCIQFQNYILISEDLNEGNIFYRIHETRTNLLIPHLFPLIVSQRNDNSLFWRKLIFVNLNFFTIFIDQFPI